jgi:hypothetical protein
VLRPELIRRVYGVRAWLVDAPDGRRKHMIPELHVATPAGAGGASGADGATVPAEGGTSQAGDPSSREEET